jgi:hypothetical protein
MTREYRIYGVRYECSSEEDRIRIIKRVEALKNPKLKSKLDGEIRGYKYEETAQSSDILNELLKNKEK